MSNKKENNNEDGEIRQLVIERLKVLPSGMKISIGSEGDFTKEQLIKHIEREDNIGDKIIEIQLSFLRSFKAGTILADESQ